MTMSFQGKAIASFFGVGVLAMGIFAAASQGTDDTSHAYSPGPSSNNANLISSVGPSGSAPSQRRQWSTPQCRFLQQAIDDLENQGYAGGPMQEQLIQSARNAGC